MDALKPNEFLQQLIATREAFWEKMNAERKSYGAEKPLTPAIVLRRLRNYQCAFNCVSQPDQSI